MYVEFLSETKHDVLNFSYGNEYEMPVWSEWQFQNLDEDELSTQLLIISVQMTPLICIMN